MAAEPCPAALPLCVCEVRGCPLYDQHMRTFGGGLHISPRPFQAKRYRRSESGTRFLKVAAPLAGLRPIGEDKAKSRTVRVLAEVDENGNELAAAGTEKTR
jgi:hypothetical protein